MAKQSSLSLASKRQLSIERWWDWPSAVFLVLVFYFAAARLQTTNWTEYLDRIQVMVLVAAGLGLALGTTRFKPLTSFLFGLVFTLTIPGWSLAVLVRADTWLERVVSLGGRLGVTVGQLAENQSVRDPILFLTTMLLLFWIAAFNASYHLVRNTKPWFGIGIVGLVAFIVEYSYDMYAMSDPGTVYSLLVLLFVVLLMARIYFLRSSREWVGRGHMVENEVGFDLGRGAAITALVLIVLAWYTPRVVRTLTPGSNENLTLTAEIQRFRERFEKAVSSLRSPSPMTIESLAETMGLGRGSNLSEETVLYVKPAGGQLNGSRYYWYGRIYDVYRNDQWEASEEEMLAMGPPTGPVEYVWDARLEVSVEFTSRLSFLRTLYFPGAVKDISRPVQAISASALGEDPDLTALIMDPPLRAGESYRVTAVVSVPTILALQRSAEIESPGYLLERYLQLPDNFSPRIQALAQDITQGLETPYDKVAAVTQYLRDNISYEAELPQMPVMADPLEWFLFTHKAGFCNYYASAEVLMLRSLGIPARLAVGYASGKWNDTDKRYEVRSMDYHAWPEVYFPNLGWVPFEPTGSQPFLAFPEGDVSTAGNSDLPVIVPTPILPQNPGGREVGDEDEASLLLERQRQQRIRLIITAGGVVLAVGLIAFSAYRIFEQPIRDKTPLFVFVEEVLDKRRWRVPSWLRQWARLARRTPIEKLFAAVGELLRAWGIPPGPNLTPAEQVEQLAVLVPEIAIDAKVLLEEYQRSIYSPYQVDMLRARRASEDMRANGYRAWMNRRSGRAA
jgi:transglutaminase-like putative cysteine protease